MIAEKRPYHRPEEGAIRARQRELLLQQAELRLKAGQFLDYCKIMIGLGEWHKAISVAPAISMQFWRDLCQQYADQLGADANPEAVPLWLSIGKQSSAVRFYEQIGDLDSAVAIAICAHPQPMAAEAAESGPGPAEGEP